MGGIIKIQMITVREEPEEEDASLPSGYGQVAHVESAEWKEYDYESYKAVHDPATQRFREWVIITSEETIVVRIWPGEQVRDPNRYPVEVEFLLLEPMQREPTMLGRRMFKYTALLDNGSRVCVHEPQFRPHQLDEQQRIPDLPSSADCGETSGLLHGTTRVEAEYQFFREGEYWTLRFPGDEIQRIKDLKGLRYLHALIQRAGEDVPVLKLVVDVDGEDVGVLESSQMMKDGEGDHADYVDAKPEMGQASLRVIPADAMRRIHEEIATYKDEILALRETGASMEKIEDKEQKLKQLSAYLAKNTLPGGKSRRFNDTPQERARQKVRKAIERATSKMRDISPNLAEHLAKHITAGHSCCYSPKRDIVWTTEK